MEKAKLQDERKRILKAQFEQLDELETQVRLLKEDIRIRGNAYWSDEGFCGMPRVEALRQAVKA